MPYRRLPNTDSARIRALRAAIDKKRSSYDDSNVFSLDVQRLSIMLRNFENAQLIYKESLNKQSAENRKFQRLVKNAKLYISHFIQVLNLCIIRGEIKHDVKSLYNLNPDNFSVPDLTSHDSIMIWGENIIKGENERTRLGGTPIYNPTIARVNVAHSQFKEAYFSQKTFQNITSRHLESISKQREEVDDILCTLWNQIEASFANLEPDERLEKCKNFGVIYYLRKDEREKLNGDN